MTALNKTYCLSCLNRAHKNDLCAHGVADGKCCLCEECHNENEEEFYEDDEEVIEPTKTNCFICFSNCEMKMMYYKNEGYYCKECYFDEKNKLCDKLLKQIKKPSVNQIITSLKNMTNEEKERIENLFKN